MDLLQFLGTMGQNPVPVIAAFFLGLMTAISPCPLATNITAIAYISKRIDSSRHTLLAGFIYTLGRMAAYIAVASIIVFFGMNIQFIALGLQHYGERLLGPFLVLCGIYLLDIFTFDRLPGGDLFSGFTAGLSTRMADKGYLGAFLLGVIFALSFCPFSAVLFFAMLLPLALGAGDPVDHSGSVCYCHGFAGHRDLIPACPGRGEVQRDRPENRCCRDLDTESGCGGFHRGRVYYVIIIYGAGII